MNRSSHNPSSPCRRVTLSRRRCAFTLIEVLAAIAIIAIVLPSIMYAISLSTNVASLTRHRTEATTLAQTKLQELLVSGDWQSGNLSGDFGDQWPGYKWSASVSLYPAATVDGLSSTIQQLDVSVSWTQRNQQRQATLSTLIYQSSTSNSGGLF